MHENIVLQTTAVATGTLPLAAGLVGVIPALAQLNLRDDGAPPLVLSFTQLVAWCCAVAFFGCFLAVPLRRQVIVKEQLVFPSGTATAHIIGMLHDSPIVGDGSEGEEALGRGRSKPGRRRATAAQYRALPASASEAGSFEGERVSNEYVEDDDEIIRDATKIDRRAWLALSWSFAMSAG